MSQSDHPDLAALPPPELPESIRRGAVRYLPNARWRFHHVLLALVVGIIVGPFLAVAAIAIGSGADPASNPEPLVVLGFQAFSSLGALYLLSRFRGSGSWKYDYGFQMRWRDTWGIVAGAVLQIMVAVVTYPLIQQFAEEEGPQQEVGQLAAGLSGTELLVFGFIVAVITPIFEEIVFRGMLLSRLTRLMNRHWAAVLSAAAFAAVHLLDPGALLVVPGLFLVGLALAYAAYQSNDLSLPIYMHMGVNGLAVVLLAYSDEIEKYLESVEAMLRLS